LKTHCKISTLDSQLLLFFRVIVVEKKDLAQYKDAKLVVEKKLGCPGCSNFYNDRSKLAGHLSGNKHRVEEGTFLFLDL
jgi:predicted CDP-diglyceride synthetase/phosphatidate cytidylyltransferase